MNDSLSFEELPVDFEGATVFLDVDGTLAPDGNAEFSPEVVEKVKEFGKTNRVLLCTNKRDNTRFLELETLFGLPVVTKRHKKPSRSVLDEAGAVGSERVVIGDKFLTDEFFARRIKARFIKVKRKTSGREALAVKLVNLLDDIAWTLHQRLFS